MQDQGRTIDALLADLRDPERAADASYRLARSGDDRALSGLLSALDDAQPSVRTYAALALAEAGDSKHIQRLVALLRDPDIGVRSSAAFALGKVGDQSALDGLSEALEVSLDLDQHLCRQLILAIADVGGEASVKQLLRALDSSFPQIRVLAAEHLGQVGNYQTAAQLKRHLEREEDREVRNSLIEAIRKLEGKALTEH
jgi:HEAT repeat protein